MNLHDCPGFRIGRRQPTGCAFYANLHFADCSSGVGRNVQPLRSNLHFADCSSGVGRNMQPLRSNVHFLIALYLVVYYFAVCRVCCYVRFLECAIIDRLHGYSVVLPV